jgi:hypothetical protein
LGWGAIKFSTDSLAKELKTGKEKIIRTQPSTDEICFADERATKSNVM